MVLCCDQGTEILKYTKKSREGKDYGRYGVLNVKNLELFHLPLALCCTTCNVRTQFLNKFPAPGFTGKERSPNGVINNDKCFYEYFNLKTKVKRGLFLFFFTYV